MSRLKQDLILIAAVGALAFAIALALPAPRAHAAGNVGGYDSGSSAAQSVATGSSHSASGYSVGGLFSMPLAMQPNGSGELENIIWISAGGSTVALTVRLWDKKPANTTCADGSAFVGSTTDDARLLTPPFTMTPAAPSVTTGDAKTYATTAFTPPLSFKNQDANPPNNVVWGCAVISAADTADNSSTVVMSPSGPQN